MYNVYTLLNMLVNISTLKMRVNKGKLMHGGKALFMLFDKIAGADIKHYIQ